MIMAAAANGWLDGDKAMTESLIAFKRAGADGVLTYFAAQSRGETEEGRFAGTTPLGGSDEGGVMREYDDDSNIRHYAPLLRGSSFWWR